MNFRFGDSGGMCDVYLFVITVLYRTKVSVVLPVVYLYSF